MTFPSHEVGTARGEWLLKKIEQPELPVLTPQCLVIYKYLFIYLFIYGSLEGRVCF